MATQTYTGTLYLQDCIECGISFGVPKSFDRERREDEKSFSCPNGHEQFYTEGTSTRLKRELEQAEGRLIAAEDQRDATQRTLRTTRGHLTRVRNRIANGVCPCCRRTFDDLHAHMLTEHPHFSEGSDA